MGWTPFRSRVLAGFLSARPEFIGRPREVKELVLRNFAGIPAEQLLERMVELSLYAEEKLKAASGAT